MLERRQTEFGLTYYASPLLEAAGVPHAFSTRLGGVSQGPFASLNLGVLSDPAAPQDAPANVRENYRRLRAAIGCERREQCGVHQVHGADCIDVRAGEPFESGRRADALLCDDPTRVVFVKCADCVPILLASPDGRAVAAVHAGWRGVVAGVLPAAVESLSRRAGQPAAKLLAAIGACISVDAFEVGPEVLAEFRRLFGERPPVRAAAGGKGFVDLRDAVRQQLAASGVPLNQIDLTDRCTYRDADEFFSHRRDRGVTGRMAALIGPRRDA